MSMPGSAD